MKSAFEIEVKSFIYEKMVQRFREWYEKIFTNIPEITLIEKKWKIESDNLSVLLDNSKWIEIILKDIRIRSILSQKFPTVKKNYFQIANKRIVYIPLKITSNFFLFYHYRKIFKANDTKKTSITNDKKNNSSTHIYSFVPSIINQRWDDINNILSFK